MSATARTALAWDIEASWSAFNRTLLELLLFASAARKTSAAAVKLAKAIQISGKRSFDELYVCVCFSELGHVRR